jgi:hypothetical protein
MEVLIRLQNGWRRLRDNRAPILWTLGSAVLVVGFLLFYYAPPQSWVGPLQPIAFSHRLHVGHKAIQCQFCHPYVGRSNHPGLPPVEKCLYCHNYIIANHWEIQKEHAYFNSGTPTPWVKVNFLAEHVLFNHQRHIRFGIDCTACHGAVEAMDRIQGQHFKMGFCINCHTEKKVNLGCWLACHS